MLRRSRLLLLVLLVLIASPPPPGPRGTSPRPPVSPWLGPTDRVWRASNRWSEAFEDEYARFVERLGRAVAQRRCGSLEECLRQPAANLLLDLAADRRLSLTADCADLPYLLRAYFAFKRDLPFGFTSRVDGRGADDLRYREQLRPVAFGTWRDFRTPQALLATLPPTVHTGMFRLGPEVETGDFYPVAISRGSIRPGAVFYDPNGHVLVVAQVRADGLVSFIDAHPDGSLTWTRFGATFFVGGPADGGGFKRFRPLVMDPGDPGGPGQALHRLGNRALPDFDGRSQWDPAAWRAGGAPSTYHGWVRSSLAEAGVTTDPVREVGEQIQAICRSVGDRLAAVELAVARGLPDLPHPEALPANIYGASGEWETYSTPGKDARLKALFGELRDTVAALPVGLRPALRAAWLRETARPGCRFAYHNSVRLPVPMTLDDVLDRLFLLSFDPYHCPERRWGARAGSAELGTCAEDGGRRRWYELERRLRNRTDRGSGQPTPLESGPEEPPPVPADLRALLGLARGAAGRVSAGTR